MKILHFVDAAGSDEHFFRGDRFNMVEVTNATSVICHFENSGDELDHQVDLTVTSGQSDEVARIMAEYMAGGSIGHAGIHKFIAGEAPISACSAIAYSVGA
jgi:hypothetical protein|tara:strand:+ start:176 stop:478 length:303 start_codon:yes stop_codon:yes gene_type:complete